MLERDDGLKFVYMCRGEGGLKFVYGGCGEGA